MVQLLFTFFTWPIQEFYGCTMANSFYIGLLPFKYCYKVFTFGSFYKTHLFYRNLISGVWILELFNLILRCLFYEQVKITSLVSSLFFRTLIVSFCDSSHVWVIWDDCPYHCCTTKNFFEEVYAQGHEDSCFNTWSLPNSKFTILVMLYNIHIKHSKPFVEVLLHIQRYNFFWVFL